MSTMPWYEWRNIRQRLVLFCRAIQGISPYRVLIEPDPAKCPSGYCNFTKREIAANPNLFPGTPKDQFQLTKAVLVHEAGHRRFTTPSSLSPVAHRVANILEDERIERLMAEEFAGVRWLLRRLAEGMYDQARSVDAASDSPGEVVSYFLQLRWARRLGRAPKGGLSPANQERWKKVRPLVEDSWTAPVSSIVDRRAEEIVRVLGLSEPEIPQWIRELLERLGRGEGERHPGDAAEPGSPITDGDDGANNDEGEPQPFDGEVPPNDRRAGKGDAAIAPQPYIALEERIHPQARDLVEALAWEATAPRHEPAERGVRLSVREYLREPETPFLVEEDDRPRPPTLCLKVIVDHSTSLNARTVNGTRMESIAESVMMLHLACLELEVAHEVIVTPQALTIADLGSGERGKALIAGLVPALCGYEDMGQALKTHALSMAERPEDIKLALCLTDGACNDAALGKEVCASLRGGVEVLGVLLDPDETTRRYVADMFGADRLVACRSPELPAKLAAILRAIRGV